MIASVPNLCILFSSMHTIRHYLSSYSYVRAYILTSTKKHQSHLTSRISKIIICNSFRNLPYLLMTFAQSKEQTGHSSNRFVKINWPFFTDTRNRNAMNSPYEKTFSDY